MVDNVFDRLREDNEDALDCGWIRINELLVLKSIMKPLSPCRKNPATVIIAGDYLSVAQYLERTVGIM